MFSVQFNLLYSPQVFLSAYCQKCIFLAFLDRCHINPSAPLLAVFLRLPLSVLFLSNRLWVHAGFFLYQFCWYCSTQITEEFSPLSSHHCYCTLASIIYLLLHTYMETFVHRNATKATYRYGDDLYSQDSLRLPWKSAFSFPNSSFISLCFIHGEIILFRPGVRCAQVSELWQKTRLCRLGCPIH